MQEKNTEEIANKRKIICVSLTYLYNDILKEFGIEARASIPDEAGHIFSIITAKNKSVITADLQSDLENIQTKSRVKHFEYIGQMPEEKYAEENEKQKMITDMLIEIGYIKNEKEYKDEEVKKLAEQVKEMDPHKALETIVKDENLYKNNEEMESVEISKFHKRIIRKILPQYYGKKVYVINCYKQEKDERNYTICAFSEEKNIKTYLFSKKDKIFLDVDIDKMNQLQKEGLVLGATDKENGANKLKRYIKTHIEKKEDREM